jgi:hypothetical protein
MLSEDYFNGTRLKEYNEIKAIAMGMQRHIDMAIAVETCVFVNDLMVPYEVFDGLRDYDTSLVMYLLLWTKNTKVVRSGGQITVRYPVIHGRENYETKEYYLEERVLGIFFLAKLYTARPDFKLYEQIMSIGGASGAILPAPRETIDDAQLKILLDAIFAIDDMKRKKNYLEDRYQVLVLGSAHEFCKRSGRAYDVIARMIPNSDVYCYDPNGANFTFQDGPTMYYHMGTKFTYNDVDAYDLVLDDTWVEGQLHKDRDPKGIVFTCENYSVKKFPEEEMPGKEYHQVFKTERGEMRAVSRDIVFEYRPFDGIGTCGACEEVRYLLKGDYDIADIIMDTHKVNCMTGKRRVDVDKDFFSGETWIPYKQCESMEGFCSLPWDDVYGLPLVTLNKVRLKEARILASSWEQVPVALISKIGFLVIEHDSLWFCEDREQASRYGLKEYKGEYPHLGISSIYKEDFNWLRHIARTRLDDDKRSMKNLKKRGRYVRSKFHEEYQNCNE